MKRSAVSLLLIIAASLLGRCNVKHEPPVAQVGNKKLTQEQFNLIAFQQDRDDPDVNTLLNYVNKWVDQELLYQEAQRRKLKLTPSMKTELERIRREMLVSLFLKSEIDQIVSTSDEEVRNYYNDHQDEFTAEENYYKFSAVKTADRNVAALIEKELETSPNIVDIYEKYPEKVYIVSMGRDYLLESYLAPELTAEIKKHKNTKNFFKAMITRETYFIRVSGIIEEGSVKEFPMVEQSIYAMLQLTTRKKKYDDLIGRLRESNRFEINMEMLLNSARQR